MAFTDLSTVYQDLLQIEYELQVKVILLFGWWLFALFYVFFLYKNQKPTQYFIVGTWRAVVYSVSYLWMYLFFLLFPVYIHPNHGVDELLLFVGSLYSVLFFVFTVILTLNVTLLLPKFIITKGNIDISNWEESAFKKYFGGWKLKK
jgi:hypothetical protein